MEYLIKEHKYDSFLAYTGNLNYDNMNNFFKGLSYQAIFDRFKLNKGKQFIENELSVDDLSMIDMLKNWRRKKKSPFLATFITMNSHYPFWTPRKEFQKFNTVYKNSMHYQDHFIGELIKALKELGEWDNTILIITGDHGRRVNQMAGPILNPNMFHTPLYIRIPGEQHQTYSNPTNHAFIGSSIVKFLTGKYFGFKEQNLEFSKENFVFYEGDKMYHSIISPGDNSILDDSGVIKIESDNWPKDSSEKCEIDCQKYYQKYYNYLKNLDNLYAF